MHEVKRPAAFGAPTGPVVGMRDVANSTRNRARPQRLGTAGIIVRLMRECDTLRGENARLRIALRGFDIEPQSPLPLVSGAEIISILHPEGDQPSVRTPTDGAEVKRAIARLTHALINQRRPGEEIIAEARAEAEWHGISEENAVAICAAILAENVGVARHV